MKRFLKQNISLILSCVAIFVVYIIFESLNTKGILFIDNTVIEYMESIRSMLLNSFVIIYTNVIGVVIPIVISIVCLIYHENKVCKYIPINLGISVVINQVLKYIIQRPRPVRGYSK